MRPKTVKTITVNTDGWANTKIVIRMFFCNRTNSENCGPIYEIHKKKGKKIMTVEMFASIGFLQ